VVTPSFPIETERLSLRPYEEGDFEFLYALQSREDVARYVPWPPRDEETVRGVLKAKIGYRSIDEGDGIMALVVELKGTGEPIGDAMLKWEDREHRRGEIGYLIHPDHQGHGFATEVSRALLNVGFELYKMHRIVGHTDARNTASHRVLEKVSMRREAHLVENEWIKNEWQSEVVYAILDREWRALQV
jgi:RimJ/RimL family protein N-acetyltransferase